MKKTSRTSLVVLLAYCIPLIFLGMYVDFVFGRVWMYILTFVVMTSLSMFCKRTNRIFIAVIGNILTFLSSYLFTAGIATEKWSYYFKAFPVTISTMYFSLFMLLAQIAVLFVVKRKDRNS